MPFHIEVEKRGYRCPYGMKSDAYHIMQGSLVLFTEDSLEKAQARLKRCYEETEGYEESESVSMRHLQHTEASH